MSAITDILQLLVTANLWQVAMVSASVMGVSRIDWARA